MTKVKSYFLANFGDVTLNTVSYERGNPVQEEEVTKVKNFFLANFEDVANTPDFVTLPEVGIFFIITLEPKVE